jgi:hypothetical protein
MEAYEWKACGKRAYGSPSRKNKVSMNQAVWNSASETWTISNLASSNSAFEMRGEVKV